MSRFRKAAFSTLVVQVFSLIGMGLSFVTVPLYLQWLGNERYGLMLTAFACAGYLMFSDAGLSWSSMLLISHAHGRNDRAGIARIVRNSITLAGVSSLLVVIVVLIGYVLLEHRSGSVTFPQFYRSEIPGLTLAVGFQVIVALACSPVYNVFIGLQESHLAASYQGIGRIAGVGASLLTAARGEPLGLIIVSASCCALIAGLACAVHTWNRHRWAFVRGSFWECAQIRQQYRTGMKSFGLQIGRALVGSAPVLSISSQAGAQYVPGFTVPLTLVNAPLAVIMSFNAVLQAAYGEAVGRQDFAWVRSAVRSILRNAILLQTLLTAGFLALARNAIEIWTRNRILPGWPVLLSALIVGLLVSTLSIFQFALTGVNRHRAAGVSELLNGALCLALGSQVVRFAGYQWVGFGILAAAAATSAWILPRHIKRHLGMDRLWPAPSFFLRIILAGIVAAAAGKGCQYWAAMAIPNLRWIPLILAAGVITGVYLGLLRLLLPEDLKRLTDRITQMKKDSAVPVFPYGESFDSRPSSDP